MFMTFAYISFGSNKGDRSRNVARALDFLRRHFTIVDVSSFYESEPVYTNQTNNFINGIVKIETDSGAEFVYNQIGIIEKQMGKINVERDQDKLIDIELLYYGDTIVSVPPIPHHKAHQRKYILVPMCELDCEFTHPSLGKTQREMLDTLDSPRSVKKIPSEDLGTTEISHIAP